MGKSVTFGFFAAPGGILPRFRPVFAGVLVAFLLLPATTVRAADDPAQVIAGYQAALLKAMQAGKAAGFEARRKIVAPAVRQAYDLRTIARRSAGAGWRKMTADQKKAYTDAFAAFSIASHANSFSGFNGEKFVQLVVDVFVKGTISEVAARRSEFSSLVRDKGAQALIDLLKGRTKKLSAD